MYQKLVSDTSLILVNSPKFSQFILKNSSYILSYKIGFSEIFIFVFEPDIFFFFVTIEKCKKEHETNNQSLYSFLNLSRSFLSLIILHLTNFGVLIQSGFLRYSRNKNHQFVQVISSSCHNYSFSNFLLKS